MWSVAQRFNSAKSVHLIVAGPMIRITSVQMPLASLAELFETLCL